MRDYRFHCEDCDSYRECAYYHGRKGTSLICKEFQFGYELKKEIEKQSIADFIAVSTVIEIIDKYTK
jgi:hypothetical protein